MNKYKIMMDERVLMIMEGKNETDARENFNDLIDVERDDE